MNVLLQNLLQLQSLEFDGKGGGSGAKQIAELRDKIPPPILAHYDRLAIRGKKGVAIVQNQVCSGCHMRLPTGTVMVLMRGTDIQLCDSCGRYLCLPENAEPSPAAAVVKTAKKKRKVKADPVA